MKKVFSLLISVIMLLTTVVTLVPVHAADGPKLLAITFDDGPSKYTNELLDGLSARGAKATFFMVGSNVKAYPEIVKRMKDEGHQLATHTMSHANLAKLSVSGIEKEVFGVNERLNDIVGEGKYYLRPPYGSFNNTVKQTVNTPIIYWSVDTEDWRYRDAQKVCNAIMNRTRDGDIILLHDLYKTSVDGALAAIDKLQQQGYVFVTVEQLLKRRGITPQDGVIYYDVPNKGINLPAVVAPIITTRRTLAGTKVIIGKFDKTNIVHYTSNGDAPNKECSIYTAPYYIDEEHSVKAIAIGESELSDMSECMVSPNEKISKELLKRSFGVYDIPFLENERPFMIGMKA